jgi:Lar family restriction alleviation protein
VTLLPCPFCGADAQEPEDDDRTSDGYSVACEDCLATGPIEDSHEAAAAAWNRRAE